MDVAEWSRALDIRLSEWYCSVSMHALNGFVYFEAKEGSVSPYY
jgi:hypothetical protein